jgi:hypothetical protein
MAINLFKFSKVYFCHFFRNVHFVIPQNALPFKTVFASVGSFTLNLINLRPVSHRKIHLLYEFVT